jgi:hypothetical protein
MVGNPRTIHRRLKRESAAIGHTSLGCMAACGMVRHPSASGAVVPALEGDKRVHGGERLPVLLCDPHLAGRARNLMPAKGLALFLLCVGLVQ